jgi:hypothetical protein
MAQRTIQYEGRAVAATDAEFKIVSDGGNVTIEIEDGAILQIRPIILGVAKTDEKNAEGERLYLVQSALSIRLKTPGKEDIE